MISIMGYFYHGDLRQRLQIYNEPPKNEFPKIIGLASDSKLEATSIPSKNIIMQREKQGHSRSNMDRVWTFSMNAWSCCSKETNKLALGRITVFISPKEDGSEK